MDRQPSWMMNQKIGPIRYGIGPAFQKSDFKIKICVGIHKNFRLWILTQRIISHNPSQVPN
jgi:hypothetical protein